MTPEEVKAAREEMGLTRPALGRLMDMMPQAVSFLEPASNPRGGTGRTPRQATKIQAAFLRLLLWLHRRGELVLYANEQGIDLDDKRGRPPRNPPE